jgi:Fe2+ transport system protein B
VTDLAERAAPTGDPPPPEECPPAAGRASQEAGEAPDLLPAFAGGPPPARRPLKPTILTGTRNGLRTFWEMSAAMVPAYFFALLLEKVGAISALSTLAEPLMGWLGLPGSAALPILLGCLLNLYAAIGAMSALALTPEQITVLAVLLLISHNLIVEGAVVQKAGMNGLAFSLLRLVAGFSAGAVVNLLMGLLS